MSWCVRCLEDFHDDDTGGYNPSCHCNELCRSCCDERCVSPRAEAEREIADEADTPDWQDEDFPLPPRPSGSVAPTDVSGQDDLVTGKQKSVNPNKEL